MGTTSLLDVCWDVSAGLEVFCSSELVVGFAFDVVSEVNWNADVVGKVSDSDDDDVDDDDDDEISDVLGKSGAADEVGKSLFRVVELVLGLN